MFFYARGKGGDIRKKKETRGLRQESLTKKNYGQYSKITKSKKPPEEEVLILIIRCRCRHILFIIIPFFFTSQDPKGDYFP